MAGETRVGNIVYQVQMDVAGLLRGQRQVNERLDRLDAGFNNTARSANNAERSFASLSKVASALAAAISVQQVAHYAEAWTVVNNKLANSVRANEDLAAVTQRVFDISQNTRAGLDATASLYSRLERATRSYGTSVNDIARLTTIINQGFVVSGATAEEASNAVIQLSQGLASGALRGEEFNSVTEQGSRLATALADSMGVTIGQLRAMAAQGKLTTDVVVNGLLTQGDAIAKEFSSTVITMGQSFTVAANNITKFVGENTNVTTSIKAFNSGIITLSENLNIVSNVVGGFALIMGGRFVGALGAATSAAAVNLKSTIDSIFATRLRAKEELASTVVTRNKALADKSAALSAYQFSLTEYEVARGSSAEGIALQNVIRLRALYVESAAAAAIANNAMAASQARLAATGITLANTWKLVTTATAPLGGPLGVIAIVAAGWYLYAQNQAQARKESIAFADTLPDVIKKLKEMNLAQAQGTRADTIKSIAAQKESLSELNDDVEDLELKYKNANAVMKEATAIGWDNTSATKKVSDLEIDLAQKIRDRDSAQRTLQQSLEALKLINIQVNQGIVDQMKAARDNAIALAEVEKNASFLGQTQGFLADKLGLSTAALKEFNSESLKVDWGGAAGEKLIKQAKRQLALAKAEGKARVELQATYDAEDAGVKNPDRVEELKRIAVEIDAVTESRKESKKEDSAAASAAKKSATEQENIATKLANLKQQSELAAESTKELTREQVILRAEQSLGKGATIDQIKLAGDYAAATYDVAASLKARQEAEQGRKFAKQEVAAAEVQINPLTGKAFDPVAEIDLQERQKLAALEKYRLLDKEGAATYEAAKTAIQQQAANERKRIAIDENNENMQNLGAILGAASDSFGSISSALANSAGESSAIYKTMFAVSKGFAIAQAGLNLGLAVSNALASGPFPWNLGAMATVAAAGANLISQVSSAAYGGARKNGGPVSAGSMYQVGEGGMPEIYRASNGSQYMIPGDNGKVISNKDLSGGGGLVVNNIIHNSVSNAQVSSSARMNGNGTLTLETIVSDIDQGGQIGQAISRNYNTQRKANE